MDALSQAELRGVLLHERSHLRGLDPLRLLLARALAGLFFFLPIGGQLQRQYALALEIAADRMALREVPRAVLATSLGKLLSAGDKTPGTATGLSPEGERIRVLLNPDSPQPLRLGPLHLSASLAILAVVIVTSMDLASTPHLLLAPCRFCLIP